ncbi:hypothetical protein [Acidomonas methanolica]|uniref:DUF2946 domain-containing protein n=1 Tax=Acidomonas methanolica NBRC 104435 TaxID=1231351 RepID=A0A023D156_ACIMT|nr:hypothetical protein [Acidomonas methanolica]MBU2655353.1 hypothetical protein [Acidomonas methanolica]TCS23770.1 hypothetical protein EDC31_12822 [Acidomonas methanolica]GAJ27857.1 hypothetical protein Amme_008_022 [Acidomonas methanolica NBRC 104435]GBQ46572.1 hypothetical protein AA0498_0322 [Acidomonas methanolica]GEL00241.1 hypothetical protein AME01nite_27390 [Acidomonas methanolica NBRC 104435]
MKNGLIRILMVAAVFLAALTQAGVAAVLPAPHAVTSCCKDHPAAQPVARLPDTQAVAAAAFHPATTHAPGKCPCALIGCVISLPSLAPRHSASMRAPLFASVDFFAATHGAPAGILVYPDTPPPRV